MSIIFSIVKKIKPSWIVLKYSRKAVIQETIKITADETGRNTLDRECPMFDTNKELVLYDGMVMRRKDAIEYMRGR